MTAPGWPASYDLRVEGILDGRWSERCEGLRIENQGGDTVLSGTLPDQPALHGILDKVRDLGLSIITVRRRAPEERQGSGDETHPRPAPESTQLPMEQLDTCVRTRR